MKPFLVCLCWAWLSPALAQALVELNSGTTAQIRGLSVVDDRVIWASGTGGQVGRSTDGGDTWVWRSLPGFSKVDFRDIEGFDARTAVVVGIESPGYILRTEDGGEQWKVVYKNDHAHLFLDALYFWNDRSGIVIGDPIDGRFFILRSFDAGRTWQEIPEKNRPRALAGEACFAASGSNLTAIAGDEAVFVSGGTQSRFFRRNTSTLLPLIQGQESTGANAIAGYRAGPRRKAKNLIVVGGDFTNDRSDSLNCALSRDGGKTWIRPTRPPYGYRSGVAWIDANRVIACGTSGVDISLDQGMNWQVLSTNSYHVCARAKSGNSIILAGAKGRIARLNW